MAEKISKKFKHSYGKYNFDLDLTVPRLQLKGFVRRNTVHLNEKFINANNASFPVIDCYVSVSDVKLNPSIKFINDVVTLKPQGRQKYVCYVCWMKFNSAFEMYRHKDTHNDSDEEIEKREVRTEEHTRKRTISKTIPDISNSQEESTNIRKEEIEIKEHVKTKKKAKTSHTSIFGKKQKNITSTEAVPNFSEKINLGELPIVYNTDSDSNNQDLIKAAVEQIGEIHIINNVQETIDYLRNNDTVSIITDDYTIKRKIDATILPKIINEDDNVEEDKELSEEEKQEEEEEITYENTDNCILSTSLVSDVSDNFDDQEVFIIENIAGEEIINLTGTSDNEDQDDLVNAVSSPKLSECKTDDIASTSEDTLNVQSSIEPSTSEIKDMDTLNINTVEPSTSLIKKKVDTSNIKSVEPSTSLIHKKVDTSNIKSIEPSTSITQKDVDTLNIKSVEPTISVIKKKMDTSNTKSVEPSTSISKKEADTSNNKSLKPFTIIIKKKGDTSNSKSIEPSISLIKKKVDTSNIKTVEPSTSLIIKKMDTSNIKSVEPSTSLIKKKVDTSNIKSVEPSTLKIKKEKENSFTCDEKYQEIPELVSFTTSEIKSTQSFTDSAGSSAVADKYKEMSLMCIKPNVASASKIKLRQKVQESITSSSIKTETDTDSSSSTAATADDYKEWGVTSSNITSMINFKCKSCNLNFVTFKKFVYHVNSTKKCGFFCRSCNKYLPSVEEACEHMSKHSYSFNFFSCSFCSSYFYSFIDLKKHLVESHKFSKQTTPVDLLNVYTNLVARNNYNPSVYQCKICSNIFESNKYLQSHMASHKEPDKQDNILVKPVVKIEMTGTTQKSHTISYREF